MGSLLLQLPRGEGVPCLEGLHREARRSFGGEGAKGNPGPEHLLWSSWARSSWVRQGGRTECIIKCRGQKGAMETAAQMQKGGSVGKEVSLGCPLCLPSVSLLLLTHSSAWQGHRVQ